MKRPTSVAIAAVLLVAAAAAGIIALTQPWKPKILVSEVAGFRSDEAGDEVRVLVQIANPGPPDRLVAVSSPRAAHAGTSSAPPRGVPIPAASDVGLAVDSAHIVLSGFDRVPEPGELFPLHLTFERGGVLRTQVRMAEAVEPGGAAEVGLFGLGEICRVGEGEPAPRIALSVTEEENGTRYRVEVIAVEFEFAEHLVDGPHIPGTGHGHLYVGGAKLKRLYAPTIHVGALPPGRHEFRVTLNTNDHRAYVVGDEPVTATAVVNIAER